MRNCLFLTQHLNKIQLSRSLKNIIKSILVCGFLFSSIKAMDSADLSSPSVSMISTGMSTYGAPQSDFMLRSFITDGVCSISKFSQFSSPFLTHFSYLNGTIALFSFANNLMTLIPHFFGWCGTYINKTCLLSHYAATLSSIYYLMNANDDNTWGQYESCPYKGESPITTRWRRVNTMFSLVTPLFFAFLSFNN